MKPARCARCSRRFGGLVVVHAVRDACPTTDEKAQIERKWALLLAAIRREQPALIAHVTVQLVGILRRPMLEIKAEAECRLIDLYLDKLAEAKAAGFDVASLEALRWLRRLTGKSDEELRREAIPRQRAPAEHPPGYEGGLQGPIRNR